MKRIFILIISIGVLAACDKIEEPLKKNPNTGNSNGDVKKILLLEEFTGVRCNNCPEANNVAVGLKDLYGEQLILLSIHAGDLATPDAEHPVDFRNTIGNQLFSDFSLFGVPVGFVNRAGYENNAIIKLSGQWGTAIADAIDEEPLASVELSETGFDASSRKLTVKAVVTALDDITEEEIYLTVYFLESGIVAPQTLKDKSIKTDYVHNHVLRASFNSTYGESITTAGMAVNDSIVKTYEMTLNSNWVKENSEVVAFIYRGSNFEIIQATELKL